MSWCLLFRNGYKLDGSKGTTTITYGSLELSGTLTTGDTFDCDVNGDGVYNSETEIFIILIMGIIIIARILIEVLCRQTKYHARAACIVGLFACYTGLLISAVFWLNKYVITKSVTTLEYSHYVCVMILGMNIACVFLFLLYYYASKRRKLTEKEKIILKDL